ncbi:hypothetical protein AEA09_16750 [Lysinibacillus contaminans]|uniref:DUF1878 domain-containing protein n=1 Tax=Lysinibacillus contaminans TaxID=1293441 RepID=A0ABR5JXJ1_9BACI|nr:hypothetical protein [Lysinibacillus contaminans]KOS66399.1 hypothetical protein AEA09_16750 [Lysinibacillus contaminans]
MNIEEEIRQLKYQIKLLKYMVNDDEFPFFMYALNFEFEETQVKALLKIISAFDYRLKNNYHDYHELNKDDEALKTLLKTYHIDIYEIYKTELPTITEFKHYLNCIFADKEINAKHVISSLKGQSIYKELCDYLLNQLEGL